MDIYQCPEGPEPPRDQQRQLQRFGISYECVAIGWMQRQLVVAVGCRLQLEQDRKFVPVIVEDGEKIRRAPRLTRSGWTLELVELVHETAASQPRQKR